MSKKFNKLKKGRIKLKRKYKNILIGIFIVFSIMYIHHEITVKYPDKPPNLDVEYNGASYKTGVSEFVWSEINISGQAVGSSSINGTDYNVAKKMDSIDVDSNDILVLKLSYDKYIHEMNVFEIDEDGENSIITPVSVNDFIIQAPSDVGQHIYIVDVVWDNSIHSSHSIIFCKTQIS